MRNKIGWRFPPTNGGRSDGFNDPGMAHFSGALLSSLARETIQNSLDAKRALSEPVHVSFELIHSRPTDVGREELAQAIDACKQVAGDDEIAGSALALAQESIKQDKIPCLRVSDRNTTGLRGDNWRALVKMQGVSHKPELEGAGGSFGIGKYAPFVVSVPRTVFYWTCYQENGKETEKFQGKSVLMSHDSEEGETQGTGFYGIKEGCSEFTGSKIPKCFRILDRNKHPVHGTSLAIVGFRETADWSRRIATSVVENFFYAIDNGSLTVMIEPDDSLTNHDLLEIDKASLEKWFGYLGENASSADDSGDESGSALAQARAFWETFKDREPAAEKQDTDLGHCRLWIHVGEELPSKVAFVRLTGMLVTDQQRNLVRFPGCRDFAALCVFEDAKGNEFLRQMENPKHDQFEPDRLPENERKRGQRALKRITNWIRSEIRKQAGPPEGGKKTVLSELAAYLPSIQPEEPFEDGDSSSDGAKEPGFGERVTLALKPVRRPTPPVLPQEGDEESEEGDGDDTGEAGGGGGGGGGGGSEGPGEGDGQGGTGVRGGAGGKPRRIPIVGVRLLPIEGNENCYRLSFRADSNEIVRLELEEAGDSSATKRDDVRTIADDLSLERVQLTKEQRIKVEITSDTPIGGRAWRLSAVADGETHK